MDFCICIHMQAYIYKYYVNIYIIFSSWEHIKRTNFLRDLRTLKRHPGVWRLSNKCHHSLHCFRWPSSWWCTSVLFMYFQLFPSLYSFLSCLSRHCFSQFQLMFILFQESLFYFLWPVSSYITTVYCFNTFSLAFLELWVTFKTRTFPKPPGLCSLPLP